MAADVELERMYVRLIGDGSSYQKMVKTAVDSTDKGAKQIQRSSHDAEVFGKTIDGLGTHMSNFAGQMRALAALQSPFAFIKDSVVKAAESEKMESAFGTMLQSAEKGKRLVQDIQELAAATPLNSADLMRGAKLLLQFNTASKDLIPTLRMLGDVTNGDAERLQHMSLAFGQMKAAGRLMGQDLLQMINAGFNPLQEISRKTGKSMADLKADMEKGLITTTMVADAFKSATSEGGRFFNGMENASHTLSGLFSTMQDDIDAAKRSVGAYIIEAFHLKEALMEVSKAAQKFTEWFNDLNPETKKAIVGVAMLAASFMSLIVVWKVGAIILGIIVGVLKDMVITTEWLAGLVNVLNFSFSGLFRTIKLGIATAFAWAPWVAGMILIGSIIAMVIEELGGFEAAFVYAKQSALESLDWIKDKFAEFKEWVRPVTDALESLGMTAWTEFKTNAHAAWNYVKRVFLDGIAFVQQKWSEMGGDSFPTWDTIRKEAQRAILFIEYTLTHLRDVWNLTWAGIKLYTVVALNGVRDAAILVLVVGATAWLLVFLQNWHATFEAIYGATGHLVVGMALLFSNALGEIGSALIKFLKDPTSGVRIDWSKIISPLGAFAGANLQGIPMPGKELEDRLRKEFNDIKNGVIGDFETFYKNKLTEFAAFEPPGGRGRWGIWSQIFKTVLDGADDAAQGVKALTHEVHKFDAALTGSAEAKARIAAFKDLVGATRFAAKPDTFQTVRYPGWEIANAAAGQAMQTPAFDQAKTARIKAESAGIYAQTFGGGGTGQGIVRLLEIIAENSRKWVDEDEGVVPIRAADLE